MIVFFQGMMLSPSSAHFLWMRPIGAQGPNVSGEIFQVEVYLHAEHDDELHAWSLTLGFDDTLTDGAELTFLGVEYGESILTEAPFDPDAWYEPGGSRKYPESDAGAVRHISRWSLLGFLPFQPLTTGQDFLLFTAEFAFDGGLPDGEDVWIEHYPEDGWDFEIAGPFFDLHIYTDNTKNQLLHDGGPDFFGTESFPSADFSASPTSGAKPLTVSFTDTSTGSPSQWEWDFGDGHTSTNRNPSHVYQQVGAYTVALTATNEFGSHKKTRKDLITVRGNPPIAAFSATPTSGAAPLTVQFTNQSTNSPAGVSWDFGDGSPLVGTEHPSHTYLVPGVYTVSLYAFNTWGNDTETRPDYITVTGTVEDLVCDFAAAPTGGPAPLLVYFTDQSSGTPTAWMWEFGEGGGYSTSSQRNPQYTYSNPGTYTVTLTISNIHGSDTKQRTDYIVVSAAGAPPVSHFAATPLSGAAPLTVAFTDQSTGNPAEWMWSFGDGGAGTQKNPTHVYATPGTYTVTLTVTNAYGTDTTTHTDYIVVTDSVLYPSNGIWKSPDDVMSLYIQKYATDSCIVIATMGDGFYTVFLDPDYRDGIDVSNDFNSQGFTFRLDLTDETHGTVTAKLPFFDSIVKPVELRFADIHSADSYPRNGVWKSPDDFLSFYLQKYAAGSCIVVVTVGDGVYTVFLDENYADGISVFRDLHEREYSFELNAADPASGTVSTYIPNCGAIQKGVELRFEDAP